MSDPTSEDLRRDVLQRLPALLARALAVYAEFAATPAPAEAKAFTAFQASCRAALAHVHLLVKLAEWAGDEGGRGGDDGEIARLLEAADLAVDRAGDDD